MISVNLAVVNALPIPIADGGLFLFLVYEKVFGRPPSLAFQNAAAMAGIMLVAGLFLLTFHLSHGIGSLFQTLGITNRRIRHTYELAGRTLAWALYLGYISIPVSIFFFGLGKGALQ